MPEQITLEKIKRKKVIIMPFGAHAKTVIHVLSTHGIDVYEIWDNFQYGQEVNGISSVKPHTCENSIVFYHGSNERAEELMKQAAQYSDSVYHIIHLLRLLNLEPEEQSKVAPLILRGKSYERNSEDFILDQFQLMITEKCSLRCQDCSHLMTYFKNPIDANVQQTLLDVEYFLKAVDGVERVSVLGGEPFVSHDLYQYINYLCKQPKVHSVFIITNGTIVPKGENLQCLKQEKVVVTISDYGELSKSLKALSELFEYENIKYSILDKTQWVKPEEIQKYFCTPEELKRKYHNCLAKGCFQIKNKKFYPCGFMANAMVLSAIPSYEDDAIEIRKYTTEELRYRLKQMLKKEFFKACDYCKGRDYSGLAVPAAIQTSEITPYYRY